MAPLKNKHILIIVENLPVPFDRRVWQEAITLKENGASVSIICPRGRGYTKSFEIIDGIDIYRHPLPLEANNALGYLVEYGTALFWEFILAWKVFLKRKFQIIHGCNPPDLIFFVALVFKMFGVKYVFDHHDVNPELYIAKYGKKGIFYKLMLFFERMTFQVADYSIATNESYKSIAIHRGKMKKDRVMVVRSGPQLRRLKILPPNPVYKNDRNILVGYVGVIGEQEGLDLLLESIKYIVHVRKDIQFAVIGSGTDLEKIREMANDMGLSEYIDFYGRIPDKDLLAILNSADICVNPDKPTEMNNISTMNKIMEYMALKKPIVQYDLKEGKYSAGKASLYAKDPIDFAKKILWLADHPEKRKEMGEYGYLRVKSTLSWEKEKNNLLRFYNGIFLNN